MKIDSRVVPLAIVCAATGWADETFTGQSTFSNPGGREVAIDNDNGDSTLTFLDTNDASYSMGIDYSDGRKFKIGYGGEIGVTDFFSMNPAGRVAFGTSNHAPYFFQVRGQANPITFGVHGDYPMVSQNGTNYWKQMEVGQPIYIIPSGITDSGYRVSLAVQGYAYTDDFSGTLSNQTAAWIRAGSHSTAPTGRIINSYALYIDNLTSPNVQIDNAYGVYQASSSAKNYFGGRVGIGTASPGAAFEIVSQTAHSSDNLMRIYSPNLGPYYSHIHYGTKGDWYIRSADPTGKVVLQDLGGNVGIGTNNPQNKLDVNGTIRAKEVIVESGWADFVFEDGYALMPLAEVKRHIDEQKRLPGVPSAAEVAEKGVSLAESQTLLLRKIEELTLYALEQDARNDRLESENGDLKLRVERIEALISQ